MLKSSANWWKLFARGDVGGKVRQACFLDKRGHLRVTLSWLTLARSTGRTAAVTRPESTICRTFGTSGLAISPVALGCWPIAGVTTLDTNDADSIATIRACFDLGINHLDTAYVYGPNGESENLIRRAIEGRRDEMVIATKCGIHYEGGEMVTDGRPEQLRRECDESLRRLGTDRVELLYLHSPDEERADRRIGRRTRRTDGRRQNALRRRIELHARAIPGIPRRLPAHRRATALQHAAARHRTAHDSLVPREQHRGHGLLAADEGPARRQVAARSVARSAR